MEAYDSQLEKLKSGQIEKNLFDPVEFAKQCIREKVNSMIPDKLMYATIDMKKLIEITSHSESYLRKNFICTVAAKKLSCSPTTKELWKYPEIRNCWLDFCTENHKFREVK